MTVGSYISRNIVCFLEEAELKRLVVEVFADAVTESGHSPIRVYKGVIGCIPTEISSRRIRGANITPNGSLQFHV